MTRCASARKNALARKMLFRGDAQGEDDASESRAMALIPCPLSLCLTNGTDSFKTGCVCVNTKSSTTILDRETSCLGLELVYVSIESKSRSLEVSAEPFLASVIAIVAKQLLHLHLNLSP